MNRDYFLHVLDPASNILHETSGNGLGSSNLSRIALSYRRYARLVSSYLFYPLFVRRLEIILYIAKANT